MQIKIGKLHVRKDRRSDWEVSYYIGGKRHRKLYQRMVYPTKEEVRESLLKDLQRLQSPKTEMSVCEAIKEFHGAYENAKQPATVANYTLHLGRLEAAFGDLLIDHVTLADIEQWIATYEKVKVRRKKGKVRISPATVNQAIRVLRLFWNWAKKHKYVAENIAADLPFRRVPQKKDAALKEAEVPPFLAACSPSFRLPAIIALYAGLRLGEVINLKWTAIHFDERGTGLIEVCNDSEFRTKSGKNRYIPIHPYLGEILGNLKRRSNYVVCTKDGKRYAPKSSWFRTSVMEACEKAKIDRALNFHSLRHTFGTRVSYHAHDLEAARLMMGHWSQSTTLGYIHADEQCVRAIEKIPSPPLKLVYSKNQTEGASFEPSGAILPPKRKKGSRHAA